ncbi:ABC-type dipeptide transport system, periplasmic component precursor [Bosea sp. LC85]|uniref:ABC transporter substrate-binding protein n=1 Tax=Bosea sp. LC85 TaxID=1502851 RepID=UPI0004E2F8A1|nr:ABC transporter substrate-binding protein [Bosea sp. LC85]KFC75130.1 ABC-type dipeptide transport system, periplasmic component precursor [Bosea sp. LC85]
MNRIYASAFALATSALVAGPAAAQSVTVAVAADIRSSNPGVNRDDNTDDFVLQLVEGLVGYAEDGTVGPLLAEKVEMSADGKAYTFTLRKGVKFHNGAELTSADVVWSWNRYMDPKTEWRCLSEFDGRNGLKVEAIEAPDANTVVMRINSPSALFLDALARTDCAMAAVIHKDSLKADGSWDKPVGTGPFKIGEWKRGEYFTMTAFDGYASAKGDKRDGYIGLKKTLIKDVKFLVVRDPATVKAGLTSGAIDMAEILPSDVEELRKNPKLDVKIAPNAVRHTFLFQTRDPLMKNVKLRQAIAASLDMTELVAAASSNLGTPNNSAIYPSSAYFGPVEKQGFSYDPAKVKKLLQEAGYKGEKISIVANKRPTVPSFPAAVVAQAMMQAAGINAEIEVLDWATQLDRYNKGNYQMQSFSYSARFDPALGFEQFAGPKDKQPRKVWDNAEAQALIDKSMVISDKAERQKLFDDLHKRMIEEVPLVIYFNGLDVIAHSKRVRDFQPWQSKMRMWGVNLAN